MFTSNPRSSRTKRTKNENNITNITNITNLISTSTTNTFTTNHIEITNALSSKISEFENKINFSNIIEITPSEIQPNFYQFKRNNIPLLKTLYTPLTIVDGSTTTTTTATLHISLTFILNTQYIPLLITSVAPTIVRPSTHIDEAKQYLPIEISIILDPNPSSNQMPTKILKHIIPKKPVYQSDAIIYDFDKSIQHLTSPITISSNLGEFTFPPYGILQVHVKCPLTITILSPSFLVMRLVA